MPLQALRDRTVGFLLSRRGMVLARSLLLLISAIVLVQAYGKAYREHGYDFTSYVLSAKAFLDGTSPYQTGSPFPFIYPLFMCVALIPLALLPYWLSNLLWFLGSVGALYFSALLLLKQFWPDLSRKNVDAIIVVPFLLLANVIQNNVLNGQVNFLVLLLCALFLRNYLLSRTFIASLFLSAAIAIKLTPLILLVYLLCRRDFITVGVVIFMTFVLGVVVPYIVGGAATLGYYSWYVDSVLMAILSSNTIARGCAFSITSIIGFFVPTIPNLYTLIMAGLIALAPIAWIQFALRDSQSQEREVLIFSLYMLAILLISPVSETHHLINLLPALLLMFAAMVQYPRRRFKGGELVLAFVFGSLVMGKFYLAANVLPLITLYGSMVWMIIQDKAGGRSQLLIPI